MTTCSSWSFVNSSNLPSSVLSEISSQPETPPSTPSMTPIIMTPRREQYLSSSFSLDNHRRALFPKPVIVYPSHVLKAPILPEPFENQQPWINPKKDRLATDKYITERSMIIAQLRRLREEAEEALASRNLVEFHILQQAGHLGLRYALLDPQNAVDLAKATFDTLSADEKLAQVKLWEAEHEISLLRDQLEIAQSWVEEARRQFGHILLALDDHRISVLPSHVDLNDNGPCPRLHAWKGLETPSDVRRTDVGSTAEKP
ncbi:hypothetical protein CPB84DRAFT_1856657 [Gymnopilus junonius]|uniref:Uncharacterized protein n=1 Tax=Gymnopilus junonius TaxID=109634 RepID=A0A9P5N8K3_GYMJU|nr:hypothetical protein CPB84DRAFT_1856657 [Gymnopilus junonius]